MIIVPIPLKLPKYEIQNIAEKFSKMLQLKPGNSVSRIVENLGGKIVYKSLIGNNFTSLYIKNYNDFTIFLPHETSAKMDRFTLVHNLGHLFLHYPILKKLNENAEMIIDRYLPENFSNNQEICKNEATWFSAAFLMPSKEFKDAYEKFDGSIEKLSIYFKVTQQMTSNRIISLERKTKNVYVI